ncbi:uracil-DNA glycosylase family protein [Kribbella sandramycini]|uniref:Uracil-DNA glycosylase n=1 Tax=Kribbella sandramycini TaxID=60450 RepID=A0A841SLV5_9ACTN|nr:uracil-DNA glycosylase [Kribbella sandramycini]
MPELDGLRAEIRKHPSNAWATDCGYEPIYTASPGAKVVLIGQAPGKQAQESRVPWNDASGIKLREWLAVTDDEFYDPDRIALLPMDFYYPGKGSHGDLPPRPGFAPLWHPRLLRLMPELRLTVLIGNYAQQHYLGSGAKKNLTETVRAHRDYAPTRIPLVHPSPLNFRWHAKNPWFATDVVPALQALVAAAIRGGDGEGDN